MASRVTFGSKQGLTPSLISKRVGVRQTHRLHKNGHIGYTLLLSFGVRSVEGFWIVRGDVGRRPEAALTIVG
jgi:hypothetical protein